MKPILHDFPDVYKTNFTLVDEVRSNKRREVIHVYRVTYFDSDGNSNYLVFDALSSAIDFISSNL
jgi:hypothetical protein